MAVQTDQRGIRDSDRLGRLESRHTGDAARLPSPQFDTIAGTDGPDTLTGTDDRDIISGLGG